MPRLTRQGLLVIVVVLLLSAKVAAQSPSPLGTSPEPFASADAGATHDAASSPTPPPGDTAPLPARIFHGSCDQIGELIVDLLGVVAGEPVGESAVTVYASISDLDLSLADLVGADRILAVGGASDPAGAVACGALAGPAQGAADLAVALRPLHSSVYSGTALLHEVEGRTFVYLVVVADSGDTDAPGSSPLPEATAAPHGSIQPDAAASPDASGLSPVRSVQPGTSGAPPFSPLPGPSEP
jgi:hypothetical protein